MKKSKGPAPRPIISFLELKKKKGKEGGTWAFRVIGEEKKRKLAPDSKSRVNTQGTA